MGEKPVNPKLKKWIWIAIPLLASLVPIISTIVTTYSTTRLDTKAARLNEETLRLEAKKLSPQITIDTKYETTKANDSVVAVKMQVVLKNPGATKVKLIQARYKVYGCMVTSKKPEDIKEQYFHEDIIMEDNKPMATYPLNTDSFCSYEKSCFYRTTGKLIEIGKLDCETKDYSFSPNEVYNIMKTILVPLKYNIVKVMVYLHYDDYDHHSQHSEQQGMNSSEIFIH